MLSEKKPTGNYKIPGGLTGREVVAAFVQLGFKSVRQEGDHKIMRRKKRDGSGYETISVVMTKDSKKQTLLGTLSRVNISKKAFVTALHNS